MIDALAWLGVVLLAGIAVVFLVRAWRLWRVERDEQSRWRRVPRSTHTIGRPHSGWKAEEGAEDQSLAPGARKKENDD